MGVNIMLKVGLVGVGGISGAHIPAWLGLEGVELVALCDIRPEQMEKYADIRKYTDFDVLTWVPLSAAKFKKRGYDQVEQIGKAVSRELGQPLTPTLKKVRDTSTQSTLETLDARRANVLGAYVVTDPEAVKDKRVLLLDDVITTGSTASECAKTLLFSGAKEVYCAALAAINPDKKHNNR
jgi:predicted amidophosphoribosyltransferase